MKNDHSKYYSELLYSLLPEIYRKKDFDKKELERFLRIIGEQAGVLRQDMDDLWYDFFIESCHDWAVPYIGDLIGSNLVFNDAARNRVEVKNTIPWRRRKGTLGGLEDVAKGITGWDAHAVEFFDLLMWVQNSNHVRLDKPCTPDLKDIYSPEKLNSAFDTALHTADIRKPSQQQGWYGIKNIGFFLFTKQMYRIDHASPRGESSGPGRYTFSSTGKNIQLFDLETRDAIQPLDFKKNHDEYFNMDRGMGIYCEGVPVASSKLPPPLPVRSQTKCTIAELHDEHGMQLMEFSCQGGEFRIEAIDAEWKNGNYLSKQIWGTFLTSGQDNNYSKTGTGTAQGTFMIRISPGNSTGAALFPGGILALRGQMNSIEMTAKNTIESVYNNALYVYLPEVYLDRGSELYLFVDDVGATYYARSGNMTGEPDVPPGSEFSPKNLARASQGQVYPPRGLSTSLSPLKPDSINKENGSILFDKERFKDKHFTITCYSVDFTPALPSPSLTELGSLEINGTVTDVKINYKTPLDTIVVEKGLALGIMYESGGRFPQSEIMIKDSRGRSTLIYLPEINFGSSGGEVYLYPADDGSTYYTNTNQEHQGKPTLNPDRNAAFRISMIARKSAGQVLPMPDVFPLQQRRVEYGDLCHWKSPPAGIVAIDPVSGRFCFNNKDVPDGSITVKYNEAFTYDVGARTYDRRATLQAPVIRVRGSDSSGSGTYNTISEAILNAPENGVIRIEDSLTYTESSPLVINKSLTLQAANFQRPTIQADGIEVDGRVEELKLDGIFFTAGIKVKSSIARLIISNCTFDPDNTGLEIGLEIPDEAASDTVSIGSVEISNSIIGKIAFKNVANLKITDSIVHNKNGTAVCGDITDEYSGAILEVERSTIIGDCRVREIYSSDSILAGKIDVINRQKGCIRYSQYQYDSTRLPAVYSSTWEAPQFNSLLYWRSDYCELSGNCPESIRTRSERGSQMGAYCGSQKPLKEKNLGIKLQEYMPSGLIPIIIYRN